MRKNYSSVPFIVEGETLMASRLGVVVTNNGRVVVTIESIVETMAELVISLKMVDSVMEVIDPTVVETRLVELTENNWVEIMVDVLVEGEVPCISSSKA